MEIRALLLATAIVLRPGAAGATAPSDLCTGDPCILADDAVVTPGSVLDFGAAEFRIAAGKTLLLGEGPGTRSLSITARQVTLEAGSSIEGGGDAAEVSIASTAGVVHLRAEGSTASKIDLSGFSAGYLSIQASHDLLVEGRIVATGSGTDSSGGTVDLACAGSAVLFGDVSAGATGSFAVAGAVAVFAGTGVVATGAIDASAPGGFGSIEIDTAAGSISTAKTLSADGGNPDGSGGDIVLSAGAGGHVVVGADLSAVGGSGVEFACGDGGTVSIDAAQSVRLSGDVRLRSGTACFGGQFGAFAGTTFTQDPGRTIDARGQGTGESAGVGGSIDVMADRDVVLQALDVSGVGGGGDVAVSSTQGTIAFGGAVTATSGGTVAAEGCFVLVQPTATLDTRQGGANSLVAHGALQVSGKLLAGTAGSNALTVRTGSPLFLGATVAPAPVVEVDGTLSRCPLIFFDDFETGGLQRWSLASTKGGKLSVQPGAKRNGVFGLSLNVTGLPPPATKAKIWVKDTSPEAEENYHARFSFKLNDLAVATDPRILRIMAGRLAGDPASRPFELRLRYAAGAWQVYGIVRDNAGKGFQTPPLPIGREWVTIALDWWRASGPGNANGFLRLEVDGAEAESVGVQNDAVRIDGVQLGFVGGVGLSSTGTCYVDDFESTRQIVPPPT